MEQTPLDYRNYRACGFEVSGFHPSRRVAVTVIPARLPTAPPHEPFPTAPRTRTRAAGDTVQISNPTEANRPTLPPKGRTAEATWVKPPSPHWSAGPGAPSPTCHTAGENDKARGPVRWREVAPGLATRAPGASCACRSGHRPPRRYKYPPLPRHYYPTHRIFSTATASSTTTTGDGTGNRKDPNAFPLRR